MDILTIYATIGAGLAVCLSLRRYVYFLFSLILNKRIVRACFQWGIRPYLVRRRSLFGPITYSRFTWWLVHWGSTFICNFLGIQNWREASSRAGTLALLHIVPLFFSQQFSMAADIFGISLKAYQLLHQAFGAMAIVQSVLHVAMSLRDIAFDFGDRALRYGFVAAIVLAVLFVIALPWVRSWSYHTIVQCHTLLGIVAVVMVRLHLEKPQAINTICVLLAACFLSCTTIARLTRLLFRNTVAGWSLPTAQVAKHRGAVKLTFNLSRPWKLRAGQYIYLKVPGLGFRSTWQSLPLYLIWWEVGPEDGVVTVTVLMKVQTGFTRALYLTPHRFLRVLVDGPYGGPRLQDQWEEMRAYDSVTLLATDIGISGQLPYVRDLLRYFIAEQSGRGTRKRISLIWEVNEESYQDWICDWMDRLLVEDDQTLILHYSLYIVNHSGSTGQLQEGDSEGKPLGTRGTVFYGRTDAARILAKELDQWSGNMLVTVSAHPAVRDTVRDFALQEKARLKYQELEFQPDTDERSFWAPDNFPNAV